MPCVVAERMNRNSGGCHLTTLPGRGRNVSDSLFRNMFYNIFLNFESPYFEITFGIIPEQNSSIIYEGINY
ncbi:hypothetical protein D1164_02690 [Mariniphaga sediminis]|uniref:Uncharacterized protein n=1 Tax=Mariniphaga sediminis TaxID=1628158 RepID=A0A399D7K7_9BACT|nr:hypothetical protein D1164_15640 [Mariniphaga sediminis]RIH66532.1 hypothetical protein D1164_02690 [Mariniphaga sediminis]